MRFSNRQWNVGPALSPEVLGQFPDVEPLLVSLLANRGITTPGALDAFLHPDWARDVHDPFLFHNMERAVERILRAIRAREKLLVFGDYDADGVGGAAILAETLQALGAVWDVYIPYRQTEGYGLNAAALQDVARAGAKVVITVDCGSTNVAEVAAAKALGLEVIITDHHHEAPERPAALAILNPWFTESGYPFNGLCGAGVAFKLVQALLRKSSYGRTLGIELPEGWEKWLLDIVTISTVADMVPLVGENRTLVSYGLTVLRKSRHLGLRELVRTSGKTLSAITTDDIAYILGPRINAAGRLNHASTAFKLLLTKDEAEALRLSQELATTNAERQRMTREIYLACRQQIGEAPTGPVVYAGDPAWSAGILGLVAGKLVQQYGKPAVVLGTLNGEVVGSGRSIEALNIIEALTDVREHLGRYGGHEQACGFTLASADGRPAFEQAFSAAAEQRLAGKDVHPVLLIDARLPIGQVDWKVVEALQQLAPYGVGNKKPRFLAEGVAITAIERVGGDQQHLRLGVAGADRVARKMIGFSFGEHGDGLTVGEKLDVVYEVNVSTWNGSREIELKMIDAKHDHEPF